jgi:hypothetical protein
VAAIQARIIIDGYDNIIELLRIVVALVTFFLPREGGHEREES